MYPSNMQLFHVVFGQPPVHRLVPSEKRILPTTHPQRALPKYTFLVDPRPVCTEIYFTVYSVVSKVHWRECLDWKSSFSAKKQSQYLLKYI